MFDLVHLFDTVYALQNIPGSIKRKQFKQLTLQFNAAIIAYDEGILSDDKVLAGALWRTFFNSSCSNPEQLEKLVHYVRKNVSNYPAITKCHYKIDIFTLYFCN